MDNMKEQKECLMIIGEWQVAKELCQEEAQRFLGENGQGAIHILSGDEVTELQVLEKLKTKGIFPGKKVVIFKEPEFFLSNKKRQGPEKRLKNALNEGKTKRAARLLARILREHDLEAGHLLKGPPNILTSLSKTLSIDKHQILMLLEEHMDEIEKVNLNYAPSGGKRLLSWIKERGTGHALHNLLIIQMEDAPSNSSLFDQYKKHLRVIDLRLNKKGKKGEGASLSLFIKKLLEKQGRRMDRGALELFTALVGTSSTSAVKNELQKLLLTGKDKIITAEHVQSLVTRHREEEIFRFTEALRERDLGRCLKSLHQLTLQNIHPLVLLSALRNTLLRIYALKESAKLLRIDQRCSYNQFSTKYWPLMKKALSEHKIAFATKMHPYSAFVHYRSSFDRQELEDMLEGLSELDLALKGSKVEGPLVLERFVFRYLGHDNSQGNLGRFSR